MLMNHIKGYSDPELRKLGECFKLLFNTDHKYHQVFIRYFQEYQTQKEIFKSALGAATLKVSQRTFKNSIFQFKASRNMGLIYRFCLVLFILMGFVSGKAKAQSEIVDNQLWIDLVPHIKINNRLEYFGGISYRTTVNDNNFRRLMVRPSIRYSWTYELDLFGGVGLFATWEDGGYKTFELRPYQGIRLNWPKIWRMNLKQRGLIEERLQWNNLDEFSPTVRFRYRIKTKFPINKPNVGYKTLYLPLSYELFANGGKDEVELFQNRSRIMAGVGYVFNEKWIAELEVTFQRSRSNSTDQLTLSDRIFRFKLTYGGWIFGE